MTPDVRVAGIIGCAYSLAPRDAELEHPVKQGCTRQTEVGRCSVFSADDPPNLPKHAEDVVAFCIG